MASGALLQRMLRAAKLEPQLYEEVESDSTATGQALLVVVLVSVCAGIGAGITGAMKGGETVSGFFIGLATGIIGSLIAWFIFSLLCFWLGTTLFKGPNTKSSLGELLRSLASPTRQACSIYSASSPSSVPSSRSQPGYGQS